jgi:hypothetical protein
VHAIVVVLENGRVPRGWFPVALRFTTTSVFLAQLLLQSFRLSIPLLSKMLDADQRVDMLIDSMIMYLYLFCTAAASSSMIL